MMEIWGKTIAVRYGEGRLVTTPLRADNTVALDFALADLHRARVGVTEDDRLLLLLYPKSGDYVSDGVVMQHHPITVFLETELREQAFALVRAIEIDRLALRVASRPRPDLTPPQPLSTPSGMVRPDVDAAAANLSDAAGSAREITALHARALPDEYVLALARATHADESGLLAMTTSRLLFLSTSVGYELPVAVISGVSIASESGVTLRISAGPHQVEFTDRERSDFARVAHAVRSACDIDRFDGCVETTRPSSADLFAEWQLLLERRKLGMVADEIFQRQAAGIMLATIE